MNADAWKERAQVDAGFNPQPVQHAHEILGRQIARRAGA